MYYCRRWGSILLCYGCSNGIFHCLVMFVLVPAWKAVILSAVHVARDAKIISGARVIPCYKPQLYVLSLTPWSSERKLILLLPSLAYSIILKISTESCCLPTLFFFFFSFAAGSCPRMPRHELGDIQNNPYRCSNWSSASNTGCSSAPNQASWLCFLHSWLCLAKALYKHQGLFSLRHVTLHWSSNA